jgi:hypothetical protein
MTPWWFDMNKLKYLQLYGSCSKLAMQFEIVRCLGRVLILGVASYSKVQKYAVQSEYSD